MDSRDFLWAIQCHEELQVYKLGGRIALSPPPCMSFDSINSGEYEFYCNSESVTMKLMKVNCNLKSSLNKEFEHEKEL
jgi:hypothetical protein